MPEPSEASRTSEGQCDAEAERLNAILQREGFDPADAAALLVNWLRLVKWDDVEALRAAVRQARQRSLALQREEQVKDLEFVPWFLLDDLADRIAALLPSREQERP